MLDEGTRGLDPQHIWPDCGESPEYDKVPVKFNNGLCRSDRMLGILRDTSRKMIATMIALHAARIVDSLVHARCVGEIIDYPPPHQHLCE